MALFGLIGNKETIYFPGCYSNANSFLKSKTENYRKILKKIGVGFSMLKEKELMCCGGFLNEAGYEKQLRKLAKDNLSLFEEKGIKKIITNCPLCFKTFQNYKEIIPSSNIEVEYILKTVLDALRQNENLLKNSFFEPIYYYDSCYLSRYLNYTEQPRELLRLLGYNVLEFQFGSKEETLCCGSCGNLPITNQELADEIAIDFIKKLSKLKVKRIVTSDPLAFNHLRKNLKQLSIKDIEIVEFSDLICKSLGIEPEKESEEENEKKEENKEKEISNA